MALKAKKGMDLGTGSRQCTLGDGPKVRVTGPDALLRHLVCQVVYLLLEETTL